MKKPILLFLLFLLCISVQAQSFGFEVKDKKGVKIPFEVHNNFMVVNVTLNGKLPLKFIFDTGAEHTILSKSIFVGFVGLSLDRPIKILGADLNQQLTAYVSNKVNIQVGDAVAPSQDILILAEDYFKIDEYVGMEVHGIIGADLFRNLVLKIDNRRNLITVQNSRNFLPPKGKWKETPVSIEKNKPYIFTKAHLNGKVTNAKLLVDTGASLSILLHTNTSEDIRLPKNFVKGSVGRGLGGSLEGFLGRLRKLELGKFYFNNVITNFQDISELLDLSSIPKRNGILGNALLGRFNIIIDYPREKLYLRAHRRYNKGFKYDRSGLELIVSGKDLKKITVYNTIENSPADKVGFQKGDEIILVNRIPAKLIGMAGVSKKLTKRVGKKIRIKIKRDGEYKTLVFYLRDLI